MTANGVDPAGSVVFTLPDLGEGLVDAVVTRWLVAEGDLVAVDQPVVEVESAKAAVEIPSPHGGTVDALYGQAGQTVPVGAPLLRLRLPAGAEPPAPVRSLVGFGVAAQAPPTPGPGPGPAEAPLVISPLVRRMARTARLDLAALTPTGAGGILRRADVEAALRAQPVDPPAPPRVDPAADPVDLPDPAYPAYPVDPAYPVGPARDGTVRVPLRGTRKLIAERMARSHAEIPDATAWRDVDANPLLAARDAINERWPERRVSVLGLLGRFCATGLTRYPELNARVDTRSNEIVRYRRIDLGFAMAAESGLVVPVIRDAGSLPAYALSAALRDLADRARGGRLAPEELRGGTFTINNHGALGTDGASPIINYPEAAQLAIGRLAERPWVVDGEVRPRTIVQLTVAFDHRVCDGGPVAGLIGFLARCVEDPLAALAEL